MIVQIDQSGKLEKTNTPTVIGFSNGKSRALLISAADKLVLKQHFRDRGKRRAYIYKCFAAIIFLLLRDEPQIELAIIDTEYPGQESIIKSYLLNFFRASGRDDIDKSSFVFKAIGRSSRGHTVVYRAYTGKAPSGKLSAEKLLELLN